MAFVMICQGLADGRMLRPDPTGQYLKSYDLEAFDGRGAINWTPDLDHAMRFATLEALLTEWKRSPKCHPIRLTDGQPNRPLTAFSVSTEQVR